MSLESLLRHRVAHADAGESRRVWFFHSHAYFDHESPASVGEARAFQERIAQAFALHPHVEVHSFIPFAAGPHPRGSFEVLVTREGFADYVAWLMFERPPSISILIHPLTRSQMDDHGARALWLGDRLTLTTAPLEAMDARTRETGRSEEDIIEAAKRH